MDTTTDAASPANRVYFSLVECGMTRETLRRRLKEWWGESTHDPWVRRRSDLVERQWPFYTLEELQELCDLLLHEEERAVLALARTSPPGHVSIAAQAYRRYETVALRIVQWLDQLDHADELGATAHTFTAFPGPSPAESQPGDCYTMVFPYDLRVIQEGEVTYFACPRDGQVMKVIAFRQVFLVEGQERMRILGQARVKVPWVLVGTPRAVPIEVWPDEVA